MNKDQQSRYYAAAHAMQSGVAAKMQFDEGETSPKHLRVGVNSALSNQGALAKLLIEKGVITEDEYTEAVITAMETEARGYQEWLAERLGAEVTLR